MLSALRRLSTVAVTTCLLLSLGSAAGAQEVVDDLPADTPADVHLRLLDAQGRPLPATALEAPTPRPGDRDTAPEPAALYVWREETWRAVPLVPAEARSAGEGAGPSRSDRWLAPASCVPGSATFVLTADRMSAPRVLTAGACDDGEVSEIRLRPRAGVHGELRVGPEETLPATAELRVDPCGEPGQARAPASLGSYPVVVQDDGTWAAPLPAGCVHLTLSPDPRAGQYAALSWWGLGLQAGASEDLGTRTLQTGASVLVRVTSGDDGLGLEGALVELFPESAASAAWKPAGSGSSPPAVIQRGTTGPWGWLRLAGLARGTYALRLQHPDQETFTVTRPFELTSREAVFDPLEIPVPARLTVRLDSEAELPGSGPIEVWATLRWNGTELWETYRSAVGERDVGVVLEGLHPGTWEVHLHWRGGGKGNDIAHETVELFPGQDLSLELTVQTLLYRGTISFQGDPVEGTLSFRLRSKGLESEVSRVTPATESDEEGRFTVFLPGSGTYAVYVDWNRRLATVPVLEIGDPDDLLRIRLPEGRLEGRVVDREGQPVAEASVEAEMLSLESEDLGPLLSPYSTRSDADGRFELTGLSEGIWELKALKEKLRSTTQSLSLGPDQSIPGLVLVLAELLRISGRAVTDTGRPIAGARGWLILDPRDAAWVDLMRSFDTDVQGRFQLELTTAPRHPAHVLVDGSGLPLTVYRMPLTEAMEVSVPEVGGRVEIRLLGDPSTIPPGGAVLQRLDGAVLNPSMFRQRIPPSQRMPEGILEVVPNLAPGTWRLLLPRGQENGLILMSGGLPPALATFEVVAGQTVVVEVELPAP